MVSLYEGDEEAVGFGGLVLLGSFFSGRFVDVGGYG